MKELRALLAAAALVSSAQAVWAEPVDGIMVVVHDSLITQHDVAVLTFPAVDTLMRQYRGPELQMQVSRTERDNLEQLVNRQLILHEFKTAGYSLPESVIDELVRSRIRADFGDEATLSRTLQARGISKEQFRQQIRDQFIVRALREKNVSSEIIISPHKVETYYQAHQDDFKEADRVKLRMIMLNKSGGAEDTQARKLAEEILAKLKDPKEAATFAEMAALYSQDSYRSQGGEHDWIEQKVLGKELAEAAATLKPGETSGVIETREACWLILLQEKTPARTKPLAAVRDQIEKNLLLDEQKRLENQWIDKLKKKTYIKTF